MCVLAISQGSEKQFEHLSQLPEAKVFRHVLAWIVSDWVVLAHFVKVN